MSFSFLVHLPPGSVAGRRWSRLVEAAALVAAVEGGAAERGLAACGAHWLLSLQHWLLLLQELMHLLLLERRLLLLTQHLSQRLCWWLELLLRRRLLRGPQLQNLLLAGRLHHERHGCGCLLGGWRRSLGGRRTRRKELLRGELLLLHRRLRWVGKLHQRDRGWSLRLQRGLGEQDGRGWGWNLSLNLRQERGWGQDWSHVCHVRQHVSHRLSLGGHWGGLQDWSWTRLQVSRSGATAASSWSCDSNHRGGWRAGVAFFVQNVRTSTIDKVGRKSADQRETKKSPSLVCVQACMCVRA